MIVISVGSSASTSFGDTVTLNAALPASEACPPTVICNSLEVAITTEPASTRAVTVAGSDVRKVRRAIPAPSVVVMLSGTNSPADVWNVTCTPDSAWPPSITVTVISMSPPPVATEVEPAVSVTVRAAT